MINSNKRNILIRCDASDFIGSGHVMRCINLAKELKNSDFQVIFICRNDENNLIDLIKKDFIVLQLPRIKSQDKQKTSLLSSNQLYEFWLGCSQEDDLEECLNLLKNYKINKIDWAIVDHYGIDFKWEKLFLKSYTNSKMIVIDDLANRSHIADILVDQTYMSFKDPLRYRNLINEKAIKLFGPSYALLNSSYYKASQKKKIKKNNSLKNILVYFGMVDPNGLTYQVINELKKTRFLNIFIDVVLGKVTKDSDKIEDLMKERGNCKLHRNLPNLISLMKKADLSIGAVGGTTWERACLNLPSIVVATAENQIELAEELYRDNFHIYLGETRELTTFSFEKSIDKFMNSEYKVKNGNLLVDGLGVKRVLNKILNYKNNI